MPYLRIIKSFLFSYLFSLFPSFSKEKEEKALNVWRMLMGFRPVQGNPTRDPGVPTALTFAFFEYFPKQSTDKEPSCHSGCPSHFLVGLSQIHPGLGPHHRGILLPTSSPKLLFAPSGHSFTHSWRLTDLLLPQTKRPSSVTQGLVFLFPSPVHSIQHQILSLQQIPISPRIKCKVLTKLPL